MKKILKALSITVLSAFSLGLLTVSNSPISKLLKIERTFASRTCTSCGGQGTDGSVSARNCWNCNGYGYWCNNCNTGVNLSQDLCQSCKNKQSNNQSYNQSSNQWRWNNNWRNK